MHCDRSCRNVKKLLFGNWRTIHHGQQIHYRARILILSKALLFFPIIFLGFYSGLVMPWPMKHAHRHLLLLTADSPDSPVRRLHCIACRRSDGPFSIASIKSPSTSGPDSMGRKQTCDLSDLIGWGTRIWIRLYRPSCQNTGTINCNRLRRRASGALQFRCKPFGHYGQTTCR